MFQKLLAIVEYLQSLDEATRELLATVLVSGVTQEAVQKARTLPSNHFTSAIAGASIDGKPAEDQRLVLLALTDFVRDEIVLAAEYWKERVPQ